MHNPSIPRPIPMQIHPKHRITPHGLKRDPAIIMLPPHSPFTILSPMLRRHSLNLGKPRLAAGTLIFQNREEARHTVPLPFTSRPNIRLEIIVPVVVDVESLALCIPHQLRRPNLIPPGRHHRAQEPFRPGEHTLHGDVVGRETGRPGSSIWRSLRSAIFDDVGGFEGWFACFEKRCDVCFGEEVVDVDY
ncbi:hypothetical protein CaCOL14_006978 [Colletotrichum acutatum]